MSTVQVKLRNGNIVNVKEGSNAHKTYANSVVTSAGTQQQISAQNTANNQARAQQQAQQYQTIQPPKTSASSTNNTSNNTSSNWGNQMSSMYVNGQQATNNQAVQANPLHSVNQQRQEFLKNGDTQGYNNFQAQQSPLYYDNGVQNKNYYANLIESSLSAMQNAQRAGDTFTAGEWERTLKKELEKYKNAPGIDQYIVGVNHTAELANQYGINQAGDDYFNSIYNNADVRDKGYYGTQMWYDNPVFQNETTRNNTASALGMDTSKFNQNAYNLDSMNQAYSNDQSKLISYEQWALANGIPLQQPQTQTPVTQAPIIQQPTTPSPIINIPQEVLEHLYSPGATSNTGGYVDNQVVSNDAFNRYLKNILTGGF